MGLFIPSKPSAYPTLLLWFFDQTHVTITAITASCILLTRDPHVVWFSIGALGSSLAAKATKPLIRQSRPSPSSDSVPSPVRPKKTYGMPSTHSTALSFYFFYLIPIILSTSSSPGTDSTGLSSFVSHRINIPALGPVNLQNVFHSTPFAVFVASYWLGGVWSRVKLGYHTYPQVFGGMLLGGLLAAGWRGTWEGSELVRGTVGSLVGWGMRLLIRSLGAIGVEGRLKDL